MSNFNVSQETVIVSLNDHIAETTPKFTSPLGENKNTVNVQKIKPSNLKKKFKVAVFTSPSLIPKSKEYKSISSSKLSTCEKQETKDTKSNKENI